MLSKAPNARECELQTRYGYLLKPIRDLLKNWEIDIAAELEEYLHDMEQIKISFDNGETVMNFAEAALLIQGSACIYSKKVEYLYALVYKTLDLIASKRNLQEAPSVDDQGKDKDVSCHEQEQEEFLPLDDIKEAKNIDLIENFGHIKESQLIPRTPVSLIAFDDSNKGSALLSSTGEVIGNRNDFKMNTSSVHMGSGALLLDRSNLHLVQRKAFQRNITPNCEENMGARQLLENRTNKIEGINNELEEIPEDLHDSSHADDMDCDDIPCESPSAPEVPRVDCQQLANGMNLRERRLERQIEIVVERKFIDPWQPLDPHDASGGVEKPFKKGRHFKLPASLIKESKMAAKKRKRETQELFKKENLIPIAEFCQLAYHSQAKKLPKHPLKTLTKPEFEYIYWVEYRRRQMMDRKNRKRFSQECPNEFFKLESSAEKLDVNNDDDDELIEDDANNDDDADYNDNVGNEDFENENYISPYEGILPMAQEQCEDVLSSYEELVRNYVQGFLVQAQQYAQETELSRRVQEWERKVVPKLENEDSHQPFDIHKYGENLLNSFAVWSALSEEVLNQNTEVKSFKDVVIKKEPWEICRYFLASLQLANNYNVEINCNSGDKDIKMDCMKLRLLHRTPAHQAISKYRAPSIDT